MDRIQFSTEFTKEETQILLKGLDRHNEKYLDTDFKDFGVSARSNTGEFIGGVTGKTYWGRGYIRYLFVSEDFQNQGVGKRLISELEKILKKRGCFGIEVDTMSFQAEKFYEKQGFHRIGVANKFKDGHYCVFMGKDID